MNVTQRNEMLVKNLPLIHKFVQEFRQKDGRSNKISQNDGVQACVRYILERKVLERFDKNRKIKLSVAAGGVDRQELRQAAYLWYWVRAGFQQEVYNMGGIVRIPRSTYQSATAEKREQICASINVIRTNNDENGRQLTSPYPSLNFINYQKSMGEHVNRISNREEEEKFFQGVYKLSSREQYVWAYRWVGFTLQDIADDMEMTKANVSLIMKKVIKKLQRHMGVENVV